MENRIIRKIKTHLPELRSRFKVKEIGVFGSRIKGTIKKGSDLDILVEFEKDYKTFDNYMELKFFLEDIFNCKVDLVIKSAVKEEIKPDILNEVVYV